MKLPVFKMLLMGVILFTMSSLAKAQDYVITTQGDTIHCEIKYSMFNPMGSYQSADMKKSKKISPDEIKEVYYTKKQVTYRKVVFEDGKKEPRFLILLEKGKINFYALMYASRLPSGSMSTSYYYYIAKGSDTVKQIEFYSQFDKAKENSMSYFGGLINDNKTVYDRFTADKKFDSDTAQALVHLYNTGEELKKP